MADSIAPSTMKLFRRRERDAWREYEALRTKAIEAGRAHRKNRGQLLLGREDAVAAAWEARFWAWHWTGRRIAAEKLPLEAHGGRVSPAALERLRRSGRLR